jgi:hypothetical protein
LPSFSREKKKGLPGTKCNNNASRYRAVKVIPAPRMAVVQNVKKQRQQVPRYKALFAFFFSREKEGAAGHQM